MKSTVLDEFDYIYVTVKSGMVEKVTEGYEALGWECVKTEVHSRYFDEQNIIFRRPHVIDHKDERQLMQVYLENALNGLGKLVSKPYPKTTAFLVVIGLILLAAVIFGVTVTLVWNGIWFACGIVVAVLGLLAYVPYGVAAKKLCDYERRKRIALEKKYYTTVKKICKSGVLFLGGGNE